MKQRNLFDPLPSRRASVEKEWSPHEGEDWAYANSFTRIVGLDEAGRGPLAGPVVAAAVALDATRPIAGLTDSKLLSESQRDRLAALIRAQARAVGVGIVDAGAIDAMNILRASLEAMRRALVESGANADVLLVDGTHTVPVAIAQRTLVKGELRSQSIAAASIIAKVTRDALMRDLDRQYPAYGFAIHKGYPTVAHRALIRALGPSPVHRLTFRGVIV
ncbi:MAG: ribonuclease HII [Deltaproteobacteria bacterium]|nr:ribonuclease HII [Deltaproteobacteria bacterium]